MATEVESRGGLETVPEDASTMASTADAFAMLPSLFADIPN